MDLLIVISLMLLAIILLLIEMFLIPGISVAGVGGAIAAVVSIVLAFGISTTAGILTLAFGVIMTALLVWLFSRSKALDKMSLQASIDSSVNNISDLGISVGDEGKTVSRLAPIGKVRVNGKTVEAKSEDGFVDEDTEIIVAKILENNVLVKLCRK